MYVCMYLQATYEEQKAKAIAEMEARAKREVENAIYENQSKIIAAVDGRLEVCVYVCM